MNDRHTTRIALAVAAASIGLAACGGGGSSHDHHSNGSSNTGGSDATSSGAGGSTTTAATTTGIWKGSVTSTATSKTSNVVALTAGDGSSVWMTDDGRVWSGHLPMSGSGFDASFAGHMYDGAHFPDGTNHGTTMMSYDRNASGSVAGHYAGCGDQGSFEMTQSPMWDRPAALGTLAGVYTRSTSTGYAITLAVHADGQLSGSDTQGCTFAGTVQVPDAVHNMYGIELDVGACGTLNGHYRGYGTLLDADAMQDWMSSMHPLEQGNHSQGGMMGGDHGTMGHNTLPTGHQNLFMFGVANDHNAIMDALSR